MCGQHCFVMSSNHLLPTVMHVCGQRAGTRTSWDIRFGRIRSYADLVLFSSTIHIFIIRNFIMHLPSLNPHNLQFYNLHLHNLQIHACHPHSVHHHKLQARARITCSMFASHGWTPNFDPVWVRRRWVGASVLGRIHL